MNNEIWLVGKTTNEAAKAWEFAGIFSMQLLAIANCHTEDYWIMPVEIDKPIPQDTHIDPRAYYPLLETRYHTPLPKDKPVITYDYIKEGKNEGKYSVKADGVQFQITTPCKDGLSLSWQELTLDRVKRIAEFRFSDGFILPYSVDGAGYVHYDNNHPELKSEKIIGQDFLSAIILPSKEVFELRQHTSLDEATKNMMHNTQATYEDAEESRVKRGKSYTWIAEYRDGEHYNDLYFI